MNMKKHLLLLFVATLFPMFANADDSGSCGENLTWTYTEATKTLTISGTGAMDDSDGRPWEPYRKEIQTVIIEEGVTSIGRRAFFYCMNMTSVTIPKSNTSIGEEAFAFCRGLTSLTIPNGVTSIGDMAFYECSGLTLVTIPSSVTVIGSSAFENCI